MASFDLTTIANVNNWLNQVAGTDSALIQLAITSLSKKILSITGRSSLVGVSSYSERYDGNGQDELVLRNFPVLAVSLLQIGGFTVQPTPDFIQPGYAISQQGLRNSLVLIAGINNWGGPFGSWALGEDNYPPELYNSGDRGGFSRGRLNVLVNYQSGYIEQVTENDQIPATPGPYTITVAQASTFFQDNGVSGFTSTTGAPGPGQYSVTAGGVYTFNAANQGQPAAITYSFGVTPEDLQQAVTVLVADNYRSRNWIGQLQVNQPGVGTTTYSKLSIPPQAADTIEAYRRRYLV